MREADKLSPPESRIQLESTSDNTAMPSVRASACPAKKARSSLFASYAKKAPADVVQAVPVRCVLQTYLESASASTNTTLKTILGNDQFKSLRRFASSMYCVPATAAPVERIFSHGGIFMRPHRARMSGNVLSDLVFTKCNAHLFA